MIVALGDRDTGYLTHREIDAALATVPDRGASALGRDRQPRRLAHSTTRDGVWLLPGTPYRDADAAFAAIRHCLATGTPFLGTCGGFQHALVELARSRAGVADAAHEESDPDAVDPVVSRLACSLVGEVRLVTPIPGTRFAAICGTEPFEGYHYCSFGLDPAYVEPLERAGSSSARPLPMPESRRSSCRSIPSSSRRRSSPRSVPARAAGSARCSRHSSQRQPCASCQPALVAPAADSRDTAHSTVGSGWAPQLAGIERPGTLLDANGEVARRRREGDPVVVVGDEPEVADPVRSL